jgi:hypothetical protein
MQHGQGKGIKEKRVIQPEKKYDHLPQEQMSKIEGDWIKRTENHVQSPNHWKGQLAPLHCEEALGDIKHQPVVESDGERSNHY